MLFINNSNDSRYKSLFKKKKKEKEGEIKKKGKTSQEH